MKPSIYNIIFEHNNNLYLANTSAGSLGKIDNDILNFLNTECKANISNEAYKVLKANGFIVENDKDEYNDLISKEQENLHKNTHSLSFVIAPTMKCNYRCNYCFENCVENKVNMTDETIEDIIEYMKYKAELLESKRITISWFGGEPLLCIDAIQKLSQKVIAYCNQNNIEYSARIITNGYLLTQENIEVLKECQVKYMQITLDGPEQIYEKEKGTPVGAYRKVLDKIKEASESIFITIRLNIKEKYYSKLTDYIDELAVEFNGINNISLYLAEVCEDWVDNNAIVNKSKYMSFEYSIEEYIKEKGFRNASKKLYMNQGLRCGLLGITSDVIGPEGEIYKCEHLIGIKAKIVATCKEKIYKKDVFKDYIHLGRPVKCSECDIFPVCRTGCPNDIINNKASRIDCEAYRKNLIKHYKNTINRDK